MLSGWLPAHSLDARARLQDAYTAVPIAAIQDALQKATLVGSGGTRGCLC